MKHSPNRENFGIKRTIVSIVSNFLAIHKFLKKMIDFKYIFNIDYNYYFIKINFKKDIFYCIFQKYVLFVLLVS